MSEKETLTIEKLRAMKPGIFATGTGVNKRNEEIKWVAVRGGIHDWAIYYGKPEQSHVEIKNWGGKLFTKEKIRDLVPCDDEAFEMYRY